MKHINIQEIMMCWGFPEVRVVKRFHPDSPRIVAKVRAGDRDYILKGIPDDRDGESRGEQVVRGNTTAHCFLDDSGIGSRYLDLGWAFIMQFVEHTEQMQLSYRFDLAKAFLRGYYGTAHISQKEYDLLWQGTVFMHISYMQSYGPDAVDSLWSILQFGLDQKAVLWEMLTIC